MIWTLIPPGKETLPDRPADPHERDDVPRLARDRLGVVARMEAVKVGDVRVEVVVLVSPPVEDEGTWMGAFDRRPRRWIVGDSGEVLTEGKADMGAEEGKGRFVDR